MDTLSDILAALGAPLTGLVVKATVVTLVAWVICIALRRSAAAARHSVWLGALIGLLILPALARVPPMRLPILPSTAAPPVVVELPPAAPVLVHATVQRAASAVVGNRDQVSADLAADPMPPGVASSGVAAPVFHVGTLMLATWLAVAAGLLVWLGFGVFSVHRILRRSERLTSPDWLGALRNAADRLTVTSLPHLVASDEIEMAFACDILRPTIVLPKGAGTWSEECRAAVLLHELAHVRRRDLVGHAIGRLACVIYWFHPLAWVAARRLRAESERACDDLVLSTGSRASDYAQHLLNLVMSVRNGGAPALALPMARRKEFEGRLVAILDPDQPRAAPGRARSFALVGTAAVVAVATAAVTPGRRSSTPPVAATAPAVARIADSPPPKPAAAVNAPSRSTVADSIPPTRQLGTRVALFNDSLGSISVLRRLSDGHVFINDTAKRQLLLLDSKLSHSIVVADTTGATKNAYNAPQMGIVPYRADTTLFVAATTRAMLVIDPHGAIVRAGTIPGDAALALAVGKASLDAVGRVVYRGVGTFCPPIPRIGCTFILGRHPPQDTAAPAASSALLHDSIPIVRADIVTRVVDTVGFISVPYLGTDSIARNPDGSTTVTETVSNLYPAVDDWAVVTDGSIAIVRGQDYHVDWVNTGGTRSSTPKVAHVWHRLSLSEKAVLLDSAKALQESFRLANAARQARNDSVTEANGALSVAARRGGGPPIRSTTLTFAWPQASDLPDYRPAITQGTHGVITADADDNLWIPQDGSNNWLPSSAPPAYDIVNRQGRLVDRVELPPATSIAGFGPGVIYLTSRTSWGTTVAEYRIH